MNTRILKTKKKRASTTTTRRASLRAPSPKKSRSSTHSPLQIERRDSKVSLKLYSRLVKDVQEIAAKILASHQKSGMIIELILSNPPEVKALNKYYRHKDKTTDVLSFTSGVNNLLGSIVIDLETAKKQAKEYKHSVEREVLELTVHGIFHLLGYDHENHGEAAMMKHYELFWIKRSKL